MANEFFDVNVEFSDGERREYLIGGYGRDHVQVAEGVLNLRIGNNAYTGTEHVASLPLDGIREYKIRPHSFHPRA